MDFYGCMGLSKTSVQPLSKNTYCSFQFPVLLSSFVFFVFFFNLKKKAKVSIELWSFPVNFRPQVTTGWQREGCNREGLLGSLMTRHSSAVFECLTGCARRDEFTAVCSEKSHRNTQFCSTCILPPKPVHSLAFDQRPWPFRLTTWWDSGGELRRSERRGDFCSGGSRIFQRDSNQQIQIFGLRCYTR